MFGKILLTIIGVIAIWFAFKYVSRMAEVKGREAERRELDARLSRSGKARTEAGNRVDDMTQCPACGTYLVTGQVRNCGRADCPY